MTEYICSLSLCDNNTSLHHKIYGLNMLSPGRKSGVQSDGGLHLLSPQYPVLLKGQAQQAAADRGVPVRT